MWIAVLLAVALAAWWFATRGAEKKAENNSPFTLKTEVITVTSARERTPQEEEAYQLAKTTDWENREKNKIRSSGDVSTKLPIKALTNNQYYCLRNATMRFKLRADSDCVEDTGYIKSIKYHPKKTLSSLVKHGLMVEDENGFFTITDLGCRAFEGLPVRHD